MNKQEIFDTVVNHLYKQGKPAVDASTGKCKYRAVDKETGKRLMCAVGCLIPDELYKPYMEGQGPYAGMVAAALQQAIGVARASEATSMLGGLQVIHDEYTRRCPRPVWEVYLDGMLPGIAKQYGVVFNGPCATAGDTIP